MKKEDILKLIESGKTDEEIIKEFIKAGLADMSDNDIRIAATECADTLLELNKMNGLIDADDAELAEAADKIYAWLYDQAWMVPKDGWKVEAKKLKVIKMRAIKALDIKPAVKKIKADQEDIERMGEIKDELMELVEEARGLTQGTEAEDQFEAYTIPQFMMALTKEHGYLGSNYNFEDAMEDMEEVEQEDIDKDTEEIEDVDEGITKEDSTEVELEEEK